MYWIQGFLYFCYCVFYSKIHDCELYWSYLHYINASKTLSSPCPFPPCRSPKIKPGDTSENRGRFLWNISGVSSCVLMAAQQTWSRARSLQINGKRSYISHATLTVCYFMDNFHNKLQSRMLSMTTVICIYPYTHIYMWCIYLYQVCVAQ